VRSTAEHGRLHTASFVVAWMTTAGLPVLVRDLIDGLRGVIIEAT
jgi:hypothetical protein